jgi:sugar O-acyltransferase (sialic acid O-acetyltransferase NeuD family)
MRLLLLCASGLAREVLEVTRRAPDFDVRGFLDDDPALWGSDVEGLPVLGDLASAKEHDDEGLLICAGRGTARRAIAARLQDLGIDDSRYATVVSPDVEVPESCSVGPGSVVLAGVVLTTRVTLGRHVVVMPHCTLTHDDVLDDFTTLAAGVALGGSVQIDEAAYLGMNAAVRERLTVGREALLGMGAVADRSIPPLETWVGVPARPLPRSPKDTRS